MATGVEVAGLVLGSLPLLLAGLQFYAEGIAVTKRYWKYHKEVNNLVDELRAENAVYQNTIETLLLGVVEAKDVAEFLANPGGELWTKASFEQKLRKRLGTSYEPYLATTFKLRDNAERFGERLKLGKSGKPQFSQPNAFKEHYKRLKFSLKRSDYADLMNTIRHANTVLHRLTFQRQYIEAQQRTDRVSIPNFNSINKRARNVYSGISSGWKCPCQADHSVGLRLESRMDHVSSDDDDDDDDEVSMREPFHILFQYGQSRPVASSVNAIPWTWEEAEVHVTCERSMLKNDASTSGSPGDKGVRFVSQTKRAVKAALTDDPDVQPIEDLCTAIQTLQQPQRDVCLTLLGNEIVKQKYGLRIYPIKTLPHDTAHWSILTLRSALQCERRISNRDRVRLAVTLASSVLQLHKTSWLENNWGIDSIYFVERPGLISYDQPFVSHGQDTSVPSSANIIPKHLARMIQNQPLFALGVALIELWYDKSLSALHGDDDGPQDPSDLQGSFITRLNTAHRLADEIADEAGGKYSDAVRRCIRCDFNLRVYNLEDVQLQTAVYQGVVAQLKATYDFMIGNL